MEKQTTIVLNSCEISRRGKGAKGTVKVSTFGIPVLVDGVAKDWNYDGFVSMEWNELVNQVSTLVPHINKNLALVMGFDEFLKSQTLQNQSMMAILSNELLSMDLVESPEKGNELAKIYLRMIAEGETTGEEVTLEFLVEKRKAFVARKKASNEWTSFVSNDAPAVSKDMAPRLNKKK